MAIKELEVGAERAGRRAKTKGISLSPDQLADVNAFEELTGLGLSEIYRRQLAPKLRAAVSMLEDAIDSGMELNRSSLNTEWIVGMNREELKALYSSPSELVLGD